MKKVCFNGCSNTVGEGFPLEQRDTYIYDRLVSRHFGFERHNISKGGSSNYEIFMRSYRALCSDYNVIFVQWSALNRIWLKPGPDTEFFLNDGHDDYRYRDIYIDKWTKDLVTKTLLILNHDFHKIIELIDYCCILDQLAKSFDKTIIYINGLVHWTDDLLYPPGNDLQSSLSDYTKQILDFENRSDEEIILFFNQLRTAFAKLDRSKWVNLFDSFSSITIDKGPEGHHPGPKSHEIMAQKVIDYLVTHKILDQ